MLILSCQCALFFRWPNATLLFFGVTGCAIKDDAIQLCELLTLGPWKAPRSSGWVYCGIFSSGAALIHRPRAALRQPDYCPPNDVHLYAQLLIMTRNEFLPFDDTVYLPPEHPNYRPSTAHPRRKITSELTGRRQWSFHSDARRGLGDGGVDIFS